jgi:hypothetical protein
MKKQTADRRQVKRRTPKKKATTTKRQRTLAVHPKVNSAGILIQNIYWNGFGERRSFKISRKMVRHLLQAETLSATTVAALVKNLRQYGFLMSPLGGTAKEWIVQRIDPTELPVVMDDIIREAEERAIDLA